MTSQQFLVCDSSTLANFKQWAQAISSFFSTAGWTQSSDTGQVNWSTIASVPGSGAYVYEVWQPNDGLTNFYLKVEYGNFSGTNCPSIRISIGAATNGAGTLTGAVIGPMAINGAFTAPSATIQYECDFSGAAGRISIMLWRNGINSCQQAFAVERSVNSSGVYTSSYVTLYFVGNQSGGGSNIQTRQRSLVFGVGAAPDSNQGGNNSGWFVRSPVFIQGGAFNGSVPMDTCTPYVGYYDYAGTVMGCAQGADLAEGVTFSISMYGSTRTYMAGKTGPFAYAGNSSGAANNALCMRYD